MAGCSLDGQCNGVFIGNNDTHDNIIVISKDKNIVSHIVDSIRWGNKTSSTNSTAAVSQSSGNDNNDVTYPFIAEDGSVLGYYHVGDTREYKDMIFQLKSNGEWVQIGEVSGSAQQGFESGYNSAVDDMNNAENNLETDDYTDQADSYSSDSSDSDYDDSGSVVTTTDDSAY